MLPTTDVKITPYKVTNANKFYYAIGIGFYFMTTTQLQKKHVVNAQKRNPHGQRFLQLNFTAPVIIEEAT